MDRATLAKYLDFANHYADASYDDIEVLCDHVVKYGFNAAFVNPFYISSAQKYAYEILKKKIKIGTAISFPLGQETLGTKIASALEAVKNGVDEIDVSTNTGLLNFDQDELYSEELKQIVEAVKNQRKETVVKFIIETGLVLFEDRIKKAAEMILRSGADFVKVCSGMGPRGASLKDVELVKSVVGDKIKIKVAGGIDTLKEAVDFIQAGVSRIGTSKAIEIIEESK
jgi:deoxyribose-phosphate aldolase